MLSNGQFCLVSARGYLQHDDSHTPETPSKYAARQRIVTHWVCPHQIATRSLRLASDSVHRHRTRQNRSNLVMHDKVRFIVKRRCLPIEDHKLRTIALGHNGKSRRRINHKR